MANKKKTNTDGKSVAKPAVRDSNIELFRIITMLLIVAHHFVVNSGLTDQDGPIAAAQMSGNSMFLLLFGAWGKIGINCFVMITGYFMCRSQITAKKFAKLVAEIMLYKIVSFLIFLIAGYEHVSLKSLIKVLLPVTSVQHNFTGCFIVFFLFIPFLNILIDHLNERQHIRLLLLLFFMYVLFGTLHSDTFGVMMNYVSWFAVLYFIAAYIRLYPKKWFSNNIICGGLLLFSGMLSACSVIACAWLGTKKNMFTPFYFVTDSNTFLAAFVGVCAFLFFRNLHIPYNKFINTVAASTFGVFLIHTISDAMRQWLWKDMLDNIGHYSDKFMPVYAVCSVLVIFAVCVVIDILRINLLEKPFFKWWDRHWDGFCAAFKRREDKLFKKLNIE